MKPEQLGEGGPAPHPRGSARRQPRARRDHRTHDPAARTPLQQPRVRDQTASRRARLQTRAADLAVAADRRRDRRHVVRRRGAELVRTGYRHDARRAHALFQRAQRAPGRPVAARRARRRSRRRRRRSRDGRRSARRGRERTAQRALERTAGRRRVGNAELCSTSPNFTTSANCARSCGSSKSRRRSTIWWPTPMDADTPSVKIGRELGNDETSRIFRSSPCRTVSAPTRSACFPFSDRAGCRTDGCWRWPRERPTRSRSASPTWRSNDPPAQRTTVNAH